MKTNARRYAVELRRIVKRLDSSSGRRVARRNALRDLDTILKRIRREARKDFPSIDKNGKEIRPEEIPVGQRKCPADGAYVRTPGEFAAHVVAHHGGKCWCGFVVKIRVREVLVAADGSPAGLHHTEMRPSSNPKNMTRGLAAHFRNVKDQLRAHVTLGAMAGLGD